MLLETFPSQLCLVFVKETRMGKFFIRKAMYTNYYTFDFKIDLIFISMS